MTGNESFFSDGHAGEYLLALADAVFPARLGREMREQQTDQLVFGFQAFLRANPGFGLVGTEADVIAAIRQTSGYANVWMYPKRTIPPR